MSIDIKNLDLSRLYMLRARLSHNLFVLRFKKATSQLNQTHLIRQVRRQIARVNTAITEQQKALGE